MNIENFKPFSPSWPEIFEKQKELKRLYEPKDWEAIGQFDIDCIEDQELFKKYCWRITEELVEAEEALRQKDSVEHVREELIDALNFTIDLMTLYGWSSHVFELLPSPHFGESLYNRTSATIYTLGLTANCLKNRQWRKSQYLVDLKVFEERFKNFLSTGYSQLLNSFGSDQSIREAWSLKYQVNLFRIQTNY